MSMIGSFTSEWQNLKEREQQIISELEQLKRTLNLLTEEPDMKNLLEEKDRMRKNTYDLRKKIEFHKSAIQKMNTMLSDRKSAKTNKQLAQAYKTLASTRKIYLASLKRKNADKARIEKQEKLIWELEAPLDQVEGHFRHQILLLENQQQATQLALDQATARIAAIDNHYHQTKRCLQKAICEMEKKQQELRAERIDWGTQSRSHLEWILKYEPSYKDNVVRRFKEQFPSDSLSDLIPPISPQNPNLSKTNTKRRYSQTDSPCVPAIQIAPLPPWKIFFVRNRNDKGQEVFNLQSFQISVNEEKYKGLKVETAYRRIWKVTKVDLYRRQKMKKIKGLDLEFHGWIIIRIKSYRIFLDVDEKQRYIRVAICPRKRAYEK